MFNWIKVAHLALMLYHDMAGIKVKDQLLCYLASFTGSPLARTKNKYRGVKPGIDLHVISQHNNITAIIAKVVTQLCSHMLKQLQYYHWSKWAVIAAFKAAT